MKKSSVPATPQGSGFANLHGHGCLRKSGCVSAVAANVAAAALCALWVTLAAEFACPVAISAEGSQNGAKTEAKGEGKSSAQTTDTVAKESESNGNMTSKDDAPIGSVDDVTAEEDAGGKEETEWTRPDNSLLRKAPRKAAGTEAERVEVGLIKAVVGSVKLRRQGASGKEELTEVGQGDKVCAGDQLEVDTASAVEMSFGMNAVLRVGESSVLRVVDKVEIADGDVVSTRRDMELKSGMARVRVSENVRTPSPVLLVSGNVVMTLQKSDAVLRKDEVESTVMVLKGEADVNVKGGGNNVWGDEKSILIRKDYKITIPGKLEATLPKREKMEDDEVEQAKKLLTFSVDKAREELPPAPGKDGELDGP